MFINKRSLIVTGVVGFLLFTFSCGISTQNDLASDSATVIDDLAPASIMPNECIEQQAQ